MARRDAREPFRRVLSQKARAEARYIDLAVEFVDERDLSVLWRVGGRWDRKGKDWSDEPAASALQVALHPGQREFAEAFGDWITAYGVDEDPPTGPLYSMLLLGGRRAGKTYALVAALVAFAVAIPDAIVWVVTENLVDAHEELEDALDELLPASWASKSGEIPTYRFGNGSVIRFKSGKYPKKLKRGGAALIAINEGQNMPEDVFTHSRASTSDFFGLVVVAANPANESPEGEWINKWALECQAKRRPESRALRFDPKLNTHVRVEQLEALKHEVDPRTYAIEVEGAVLPSVHAVHHAFDLSQNVAPVPEMGNVTAEYALRCALGRNVTDLVGLDFQRTPHMAGVVARAYRNPSDERRPLLYAREEIIVDLGDEHDLSDAMFALDLDPATTVLVGDASGFWQDADRTRGGRSAEILMSLGWKRIHRPDPRLKINPPVHERVKNVNRLCHSEAGDRLALIDPALEYLIEAVTKWRKKNGIPNKHSKYAHICEAWGYLLWRLYTPQVSREVGYKRVTSRKRRRQLKGW